MTQNLRRITTQGLLWGLGGRIALIVANFAVLVVTSRVLGPVEFGVFAAATIFIDLSWVLANSTLGVSLIQRKDLTEQDERGGFAGYVVMSACISILLAAGAPWIEQLMKAPGLTIVLWVVSAILPIRILAGFYGALVQRRLDFKFYQMTQSMPQIVGGAVTIAAAVAGLSFWALVLGFGLSSVLECGLLMRRAKFDHHLPANWRSVVPLIETALASASHRLLNFAATNVDRMIVGAAFGPSALAIYTRAYSLMMVPVKLIGMSLSRLLLAVFSKIQDDSSRLGRAVSRVVEAQTLLHLPLGIGLALSAPVLVHTVLGSTWDSAVLPTQVFFLALVARLGTVPLEAALVGSGQAWAVARLQFVYAMLVLISAYLGSFANAVAIASGVTCALLVQYVLQLTAVVRRFQLPARPVVLWHVKAFGLSLLCSAPALGLGFAADRQAQWNWPSIPAVVAYWAIFLACILLGPESFLGEEIKRIRTAALERVLKRRNRT